MARITKLIIENFKRIQAIEYSPTGNVTVVGGMNEQGKSSLLDSISVLLEGKTAKIPAPVRNGAKKARIVGEITHDSWDAFGDCTIIRTISAAGNWSVKIQDKDGKTVKSPETVLRKIFGDPVDPVAFIRMSNKERVETFKKITGLDFSKLDADRQAAYDNRTIVGREVTALEGALKGLAIDPDAPEKEVSVDELMAELEEKEKVNKENEKKRNKFLANEVELEELSDDIDEIKIKIKNLQAELIICEKQHSSKTALLDQDRPVIESLKDNDLDEVKTKIKTVGETNKKVAANLSIKTKQADLAEKKKEYESFTTSIQEIDENKKRQMEAVKLPVDGLSFDDETVLYKGLPFDEKQLSSEELIRVSFAISIAAQPNLKNILIKEGSLLDENNLKLIAEMAEENDIHVFIEVVGDDAGKSTIVIENGSIKGDDKIPEDDFEDEDI